MAKSQEVLCAIVMACVVGCGPRAAQVTSAPAEATRTMAVRNATAQRVELFLVQPDGAVRPIGQLSAGATTELSVKVGRTTPTISAYIGSGMTRTSVPCTYPVEQNGRLSITCGL
jgi:hypothetical protein